LHNWRSILLLSPTARQERTEFSRFRSTSPTLHHVCSCSCSMN